MNEQIQTIIDRARVLLADATPGPLAVGVGEVETEDAGRHRAVLIHTDAYCVAACGSPGEPHSHADAEALAFAVNNIGTLCDALVDAERRAAETDAQAAAMREALVEIGREWTIDEDGCAFCGDGLDGDHDGCPGMIASKALANPAGRALLDRLTAAEARVADMESVRKEQAAKLRRHLDELRAAALHIEDLESKNARMEDAEAERDALRDRAGIAEGREACAKANAAEMAGWLTARNAGLVQMARDRDAALAEVEALKVERDVADRECSRLRAQVDADRQELTRMAEKVARMEVCAPDACAVCTWEAAQDEADAVQTMLDNRAGDGAERNDAEAEIVAAVVKARAAGLSIRAIVDELRAAGMQTRRGTK